MTYLNCVGFFVFFYSGIWLSIPETCTTATVLQQRICSSRNVRLIGNVILLKSSSCKQIKTALHFLIMSIQTEIRLTMGSPMSLIGYVSVHTSS